jgi:hypothetical protein
MAQRLAGLQRGAVVSLAMLDGSEVWAECLSVGGAVIALLVHGVAHVTIASGSKPSVRVEFKAPALWREGWATLAGRWLASVAAWMGRTCDLSSARAAGWRVTALEICRDFQGLGAWDAGPAGAWMGWRAPLVVSRSQGAGSASVSVGTRSGAVSLCCYSKTGQLADAGIGDAAYRAAWEASGRFDATRPIQRVEYRLRKRGLDLADATTGECGVLRDPAALADAGLLGRV